MLRKRTHFGKKLIENGFKLSIRVKLLISLIDLLINYVHTHI